MCSTWAFSAAVVYLKRLNNFLKTVRNDTPVCHKYSSLSEMKPGWTATVPCPLYLIILSMFLSWTVYLIPLSPLCVLFLYVFFLYEVRVLRPQTFHFLLSMHLKLCLHPLLPLFSSDPSLGSYLARGIEAKTVLMWELKEEKQQQHRPVTPMSPLLPTLT